jgi:hypothetical protein
MSAVSRSIGRQTKYGQYGTVEYMANISELGRDELRRRYGDNWAQELGYRSSKAIQAKYGPNGHRWIGQIGGDTVSCKYWGKHCEEISGDYVRLAENANYQGEGSYLSHRGSSRSRSPSRRSRSRSRSPARVMYGAKSKNSSSDEWDWEDTSELGDIYGSKQRSAGSSKKSLSAKKGARF